MSAEIVMRPGDVIPNRGEFIDTHPVGAIALDGYVQAPPFFEQRPDGAYRNFDHHAGVDRAATRSTAEQVYLALHTGMTEAFKEPGGEFDARIYMNDIDQDATLAAYMLFRAESIPNLPSARQNRLRELVRTEGELDTLSGAGSHNPRDPLVEKINHIFEPYLRLRQNGELYQRDGQETTRYTQAMMHMFGRISLYLDGDDTRRRLNTKYKAHGGGKNWLMFTEEKPVEGRLGAFSDKIRAFVIPQLRPPNPTDKSTAYTYSVGRVSEYIGFDVPGILNYLQEKEQERAAQEGRTLPPGEQWGGSDLIGGSPRKFGSRLHPKEVQDHINHYQESVKG